MTDYVLALFLHIVGALGFFVALGLEWMVLRQFPRVTTRGQVRAWIGIVNGARRLGMASMAGLLISGFYMMARFRMGGAWLIVAFWALVLLSVLAVVLSGRRMAAITRAMTADDGQVSSTLHHLLRHPLLWIAINTRVAIALGIVYLMTAKPPLYGALLVIGVAGVVGVASALPLVKHMRAVEEPAT